jgi:hypothetical protein
MRLAESVFFGLLGAACPRLDVKPAGAMILDKELRMSSNEKHQV